MKKPFLTKIMTGLIIMSMSTVALADSTNISPADLPDLSINYDEITCNCSTPFEPVIFTAGISNTGSLPAENVKVQIYDFSTLIGETKIAAIPAEGSADAVVMVPAPPSGDRMIEVVVDPDDVITELNEENNEESRVVEIGCISNNPMTGNIMIAGGLLHRACTGSQISVFGQAAYTITPDSVYLVKGGVVKMTTSWHDNYSDSYTDINGEFRLRMLVPETPGKYSLNITVTDNTFVGTKVFNFKAVACSGDGYKSGLPPSSDIWSDDGDDHMPIKPSDITFIPSSFQDVSFHSDNIHFSNEHPMAGEKIVIGVKFYLFTGRMPLVAESVPINVYTYLPGTPKTLIHESDISISAFDTFNLYVDWKPETNGIYLVEVEISPMYFEEKMENNVATRTIIVGETTGGRGSVSGHIRKKYGGMADVAVRLLDSNGSLASTVTDAEGRYLFEEIPVGKYLVKIVTPNGYGAVSDIRRVKVIDQTMSTADFQLFQR